VVFGDTAEDPINRATLEWLEDEYVLREMPSCLVLILPGRVIKNFTCDLHLCG